MFVPLYVNQIIRRAEKIFSDKIGVIDGEKRFTYEEFAKRANQLSNALLKRGIKAQETVSFICYNTHHLLEAYYGVPQIGCILNTINIRFRPDEIAYVLNNSEAKIVFFHKDFWPVIKGIRDKLININTFVVIEGEGEGVGDVLEYENLISSACPKYPGEPPIKETDIAELFYTSGTTGNPKGVMLSHRAICLHALSFLAHYHYDDSDVQLHAIPLFHVNGWGTPQVLTWVGGTHVMLRQFDPKVVQRIIDMESVTRIFLVPTMINMLLKDLSFSRYNLSSLKLIIIGGAPTVPEKVREIEEKFGCKAISAYGMTETSPVMCNSLPKAHKHKTKEEKLIHQAKTGVEMIGVNIRVVDADGKDVKNNGKELGEIVCRANSVMHGYWKLPEETDLAIVDGWFHTGDIAVIDEDYYVTIVDRQKDIIISGGENIASIEVENTINSHAAVLESAVVGIPDEKWGEIPKAFVVLKPEAKISEEDLIAYCKQRISGYKAPRQVEFIDTLPKSGTGKILKRTIRDQYWQGMDKRVKG